ncbi:hypothetical protein BDQ12DRAFT_669670 [Crucibulum laeve]|uniref:Uncharacterized protein n=1 Tax=Crucibulum laeve TaxID=68775 RepID=A0A5C3LP60_9AGAR|nr:hypothetical protein BDQ12DRAFT_669670 [Crucibulum laeve]
MIQDNYRPKHTEEYVLRSSVDHCCDMDGSSRAGESCFVFPSFPSKVLVATPSGIVCSEPLAFIVTPVRRANSIAFNEYGSAASTSLLFHSPYATYSPVVVPLPSTCGTTVGFQHVKLQFLSPPLRRILLLLIVFNAQDPNILDGSTCFVVSYSVAVLSLMMD